MESRPKGDICLPVDHLLISTKFAPTRISPQTTSRARLLARLREARGCRLTLVCGSAGFGKTTLLAQWRQELLKAGENVSWLSLSQEEQQFPQFRAYLLGALQRAGLAVEDGTALPSAARAELSVAQTVATIVDAACQSNKSLFLFIDDYHHVDDALTHALIQGLLSHCPEGIHLILASRTSPPLAISRMRLTGDLMEIALADLPFDFQETQDFLGKQLGAVTPDDAHLIHDITSGWPLCVQMICIRIRRTPANRGLLPQLLQHRGDLQRYLSEDVVRNLPCEMVDFIEKISICRRFNADLIRHVTGNPQARALLDQLESDNLLLLPVEQDGPFSWYRLHPLFASFLQQRLSERDPQLVRQVHARASQWFETHGWLIEALRHAYHADDLQAAARVVERADLPIRSMSFVSTLQRWMNQLAPEVLMTHPRLLVLGCWALAAVCRWREAQTWLDRLQQTPAASEPEFVLHARYLRASIALQRDDTDAALTLIAPSEFNSLKDRFLRQIHLAVLSLSYCAAGRYADARTLHRSLARLPRAELLDDMALTAESTLLLSHLLEGTNSEAIRIAGALVVRSENAHGRRSTSAVNCAAFAADAYYEADRLAQARDVLAHRLDLLRLSSPEPMIRALITRNRLSALQLSPQEVLSSLAEDETQCRKQALDRPLAYLLAEQGRLQLLLGHKEAAQALQTELDALAERHGAAAGFLAEIVPIAALAGTRLALANGNAEAALAEIRKLRQHGIAFARQKSIVLADLLSGRAFDLMGRDAQSRHCLITGIDAARQLGLVRTILDEGAELQVLLKRLLPTLDAGSMREYLADIFRRADAATASQLASNEAAAKARGQVLKPREIEILKLLGHSMSNKRIALTLNITLETVKWNLKNIFGKLNAPSRYHAVMIARKHGLID